MKAVVYDGGLVPVDDYPLPKTAEGEARVRVRLAGICNTDLEITKGYMDFSGVLGHEFVGEVTAVTGVLDEGLVGKRVTGEINIPCGLCETCRAGNTKHCPERTVLGIVKKDGAMAEYLTLPVENLHLVPEGLSDEEAVFAEPLAAAFEVPQQVHIKPSSKVLVMGDGKLGLLCVKVLRLTGTDITLSGKHKSKLAIVAEDGVRTITADEYISAKSFDVVVEATGTAEGFTSALGYVKAGGTLVLKSTVAKGAEINLAQVVVDEITVVGSRCGPFAPALRAMSEGVVDVKPLLSEIFTFDKAEEAFAKAAESDTLKVLIDFRAF